MTNQFLTLSKARRTIYVLNKDVPMDVQQIDLLIKEAIKHSPSSFNSQSSRALILFGTEHDKLWDITEAALRKVVPAEHFATTQDKIASFRAAAGTVVFFEDEAVVKSLQENYSLYAHNFPIWSLESSGMAQLSVWIALAEQKIGASLQHYNELIEEEVKAHWQLPDSWIMRAQMPFGGIVYPADDKAFIDDSKRFKTAK